MYFVTGLSYVLQQPPTCAGLAKTKADISQTSALNPAHLVDCKDLFPLTNGVYCMVITEKTPLYVTSPQLTKIYLWKMTHIRMFL